MVFKREERGVLKNKIFLIKKYPKRFAPTWGFY
jgi:hypothetical protein